MIVQFRIYSKKKKKGKKLTVDFLFYQSNVPRDDVFSFWRKFP